VEGGMKSQADYMLRTALDMKKYRDQYLSLFEDKTSSCSVEPVAASNTIFENYNRSYFLPEFMYIMNCIPESIVPCHNHNEIPMPLVSSCTLVKPLTTSGIVPKFPAISQSISAFKKGHPPGNSGKLFRDNIERIKDIISVRMKIQQLENNREDSFLIEAESDQHESEILPDEYSLMDLNEDDFLLNEETALHCLEKFSALFLMHSGFDGK
jgi:hypothetical protein